MESNLRDTEVSYAPIEDCPINAVAVMNEEAWWRSIRATAFNHQLSRPNRRSDTASCVYGEFDGWT